MSPKIVTGTRSAVRNMLRVGGVRNLASSTTRRGERRSRPGSRQVSSGLSSATVLRPTRMASARARRMWANCARLRPCDPARRAVAGRDQAVAGDRNLQLHERAVPGHAQDVPGRHPSRLLRAQPEVDRDAGIAQHGEAPAGDLAGWGPRSAHTTRRMPAATMASAQGGVRP